MARHYTKTKFMTLAQVTKICSDPYARGNLGEGKDYHDQIFDIQKRKWDLEDRKREKDFEKHLKDWEIYQNEIKI